MLAVKYDSMFEGEPSVAMHLCVFEEWRDELAYIYEMHSGELSAEEIADHKALHNEQQEYEKRVKRLYEAGIHDLTEHDIYKKLPAELIGDWNRLVSQDSNGIGRHDQELQDFINDQIKKSGELQAVNEQKTKTDERIAKAKATRKELELMKPQPDHIIYAYKMALRDFAAMEHGDSEANKAFWLKVIQYANLNNLDDDDDERGYVDWNPAWTTMRNRIGEYRKAGLIK